MSPVALNDATMTALFRRRQADFVDRTESQDAGRTWSTPAPTDLPNHNSSIAAIALDVGRVAVICNPVNAAASADRRTSLYEELGGEDDRPEAGSDRRLRPIWGVPRAPVMVCISSHGGLTFPQRIQIEHGP